MNNAIYNYHPVTRELLGPGEADESPLEHGVLLLPAHSTRKAPPPTGEREAAVFNMATDDWTVVQDYRDADLFSVLDGAPVTISELGPQPPDTTNLPRPSLFHDWNGAGWTANSGKILTAMWESIQAERARRKAGGVKVGTKWYHSDADSRIQYLGLKDQARDLLAAGQPDTTRLQKLGQDIKWKTMDGSFIFMTVKHAFDIVSAVGDLDAKAFGVAENHKAAVEAADNPLDYDFSAGWPAIYKPED